MATSTLFKIDDSSPLIRYDPIGQWGEGSPALDPLASKYFGNMTFRTTVEFGASASFDFNGTAITIGGAKRGNHGPYQVLLDGQPSKFNGSATPDIFQTALFEASGLKQGLHNIKIVNQPEDTNFAFLDIDFIEWHSDIQGTQSRTVEDGNPGFKYTPASAWSTDASSTPGYSSGNGHFTTTDKASVAFNFQGDAVQLIGSIGPDHGVFTASLDGQATSTLNATHGTYQPQQMLFFADSLGPGQHTLTVTRVSGKLGIDCATVIDFNGKQPQKLNVAAIAGIAVGGVVVLALIILGFFFWKRKQRRRSAHVTAGPIILDSPHMSQTQLYAQPSTSYYPGSQVTVADPYAVMPGTGSYSYNSGPAPRQSQYSYADGPGSASGSSSSSHAIPGPSSIPPPLPSSVYSLPGQQRSASNWRSPNEKDPNRSQFPGREQDGGPAPMPEDPGTARLPPDYFQATAAAGPPPRPTVGKI